MSDPIRSISQNNYILATQQEVSHDNTLTGNGTEESPLGLNETVLWSGAVTGSAFSVTLSEDCQNFEKLQFIGGTNSSPGHPMYGQTYTNDLDANGKIQCSMLGFDTNHIKVTIMELSGTKLKSVQMFEDDILNTAAGTLKNNFYIYKVVGINRISNS